MQNIFLDRPIPAKKNAVNALVGGLNEMGQGAIQNYQASERNMQQSKALQALGLAPEVASAAVGNPKIMEALIQGQIDAKNPKTSGGLTTQSIKPEVMQSIGSIMQNSQGLNSDELAQAFGQYGVPPQLASPYIENRRRQDEAKSKYDLKKEERGRAEELEFHKESSKYDEELREASSRAQKQEEAVKDINEAIASGKVKPGSIASVFRGMGKIGDKIADAFTNAEQGKFEAALPLLIEGWKEVFGVRLSDADLNIIKSKLPGLGKDPEANKAILKIVEKYSKPAKYRAEIGREIKKQNKGLRPLGYADQVEEALQKRLKAEEEVIMIAPNGKRKKVPAYMVDQLIQQGGKLAQ